MVQTLQDARVKVEAGAEFLNNKLSLRPFWYTQIDLDSLIMSSSSSCIVGQLFGDYMDGLDELGIGLTESRQYGFTGSGDDFWEACRALNTAWREYIEARIAEDKDRAAMSYARQYVRNGTYKLEGVEPHWYNTTEIDVEDTPSLFMAGLRMYAGTWFDVYGTDAPVYGFLPGVQATEEQLAQAWKEKISELRDKLEAEQEQVDEEEEQVQEQQEGTYYIVMDGPFSIGTMTADKGVAEGWIEALTSIGKECSLVEKKVNV